MGIPSVIHCLDDFSFAGLRDSDVCAYFLRSRRALLSQLQVWCTRLSFLGIKVDTQEMVFRLLDEKLGHVVSNLDRIVFSKMVTLRQLQSFLVLILFQCRFTCIREYFFHSTCFWRQRELYSGHQEHKEKCAWQTDSTAVVQVVNGLPSGSLPVLALLHHFVLRCLQLSIWFRTKHVPEVVNKIADALV